MTDTIGFVRRGGLLAVIVSHFLFVAGGGSVYSYDRLAKSGGAAGVKVGSEFKYVVYNSLSGTGYSAVTTEGVTERIVGSGDSISKVMTAVMVDAMGEACHIQLGTGVTPLNLGSNSLVIDGAVVGIYKWGDVRLTGALKSVVDRLSKQMQALVVSNGAVVECNATISTTKEIAVQVNDSSEFTYNGETPATSCGKIVNKGAKSIVTVISGIVSKIDNEGGGRLDVVGGFIGSNSAKDYAIKNGSRATANISGDARIVSADTSYNSGTIVNHGELNVSGGKVSNEFNGSSIAINNKYDEDGWVPVVNITGTADIYTTGRSGVVYNYKGELTISGGYVHNDEPLGRGVVFSSNGKAVISDSAKIESNSDDIGNRVVESIFDRGDERAFTLDIIGGKIVARRGYAVFVDGGGINGGGVNRITGKAEISTGDSYGGAVFVGNRSSLLLYGGKIKNSAAENNDGVFGVGLVGGGRGGPPGTLEIGGSPIVKGRIGYVNNYMVPIKVTTDGEYKFKPNGEKYHISLDGDWIDSLILENGAGVVQNFVADTARSRDMKLAVNGDDVYFTTGRTYNIDFDINGAASGDAPAIIPVIPGGTIGESAKPPMDDYIIFENIRDSIYMVKNDGDWHRSYGNANGKGNLGAVPGESFIFGTSKSGTEVKEDRALTISWTGKKTFFAVSVLESSRDLPSVRPSEAAAIAPAVAVSGSFTAGPSPVSSSSGNTVGFFRSGAALKDGKLFIYDAAGDVVATVNVNDNCGNTNRRRVAEWDLKDAKGRQAAEGTYVARGIFTTKAGKSERVSVLINVQR